VELILARLRGATLFLLAVVISGTVGIHAIGGGRWTWFQALFHTLITLTTVGYGELPGMETDTVARAFSLVLVIVGAGSVVYFASIVTALFVEGELRDYFRRSRMNKVIAEMQGHVIVCGVGRTGMHIVEELTTCAQPFVAIDSDVPHLERLHRERPGLRYLVGDATEDEVLRTAGIERAHGLVAALSDDQANLYVTLSARSLNPSLRIIAKAVEQSAVPKLARAGADKVVSTNRIGGLRLASEMIRPNVTEFLDMMMRDPKHVLRIEEVPVKEGTPFANKTLAEASIRKVADVLVVAVRGSDGSYRFNPGAETQLRVGSTLIFLGELDQVLKLRAALNPTEGSATRM
jgi:voltage-gated potassium channel